MESSGKGLLWGPSGPGCGGSHDLGGFKRVKIRGAACPPGGARVKSGGYVAQQLSIEVQVKGLGLTVVPSQPQSICLKASFSPIFSHHSC